MPRTDLFRVGTIEQDTLDELNAMLTELYASVGVSDENGSGNASFDGTVSATTTIIPASDVARNVIIQTTVTEIFADGDGGQPDFTIGEDGGNEFAILSNFTDAAAGALFSFAGVLAAGAALTVTVVAGTGTTETGAMDVTAIASAQ